MKRSMLLLLVCTAIPLAMCRPQTGALKKITFLPMWVPQPQFAGYYMAKEKGIYERYGLDVTIGTGGYHHDVQTSLVNGEADFGTLFLYTGVMARAQGTPIVNIGQIFQRSSIMFVAKKSSGIRTLADFNGRRIGIWRTVVRELTTGFLRKHGVTARLVPFDKGINVFLKDAVDITVMMSYNEYKRMINSGVNPEDVTTFNFYDYGMNFPEDGIYCLEKTFTRDPEMCRKFVRASIEGWNYALAHPDETVETIDRYRALAKVSYNHSHSLWMLNSMTEIVHPPKKQANVGELLETDFHAVTTFLYENKVITTMPSHDEFYKECR